MRDVLKLTAGIALGTLLGQLLLAGTEILVFTLMY